MLAVAVCAGGARVRGRLRGGPSSRSEDGLADLGAISDCSGGDVRSAMTADAACMSFGELAGTRLRGMESSGVR
jgi:hypothetical protein